MGYSLWSAIGKSDLVLFLFVVVFPGFHLPTFIIYNYIDGFHYYFAFSE